MPTMVCITLFLIMYLFLRDGNKDVSHGQMGDIICSVCEEKLGITYDYCPSCRTKLQDECNHCNNMINVNWRYYPYCGITRENR